MFVPNISDASPRVITEAKRYDMPVLVNENILGGWHNIIPGETGEFFTNEVNVSNGLNKITTNLNTNHEMVFENREFIQEKSLQTF